MISTGTFYPNRTGARTLADARPLYAGDERVSIEISADEITLFFGLRLIAVRDRRDFLSNAELAEWANKEASRESDQETETVDGFEVETVDVMELRYEDQVVFEGMSARRFVPVTTAPFRPEYYNGRTGGVLRGDPMVSISGTRKSVKPGTTFRRAVNPRAVEDAQRARSRQLLGDLHSIARDLRNGTL